MSQKPTYIQYWVLSELRDKGPVSASDLGVQVTIFERLSLKGYVALISQVHGVLRREAKWQITLDGLAALGRYKISQRSGVIAA